MKATKNTGRVVVKRLAYRDWVVLLDDKVVSRVTSGELAYAAATDMLDEKKVGSRQRPVRCVETGTEFDSISIAMDEMGISDLFSALANGGTAGGLHWEYVNPEDKIQRLSGRSPRVKVKVKCVETGEVFKSLREGAAKTGASRSSLWRASLPENSHLTAGGYHWTRV